MWASFCGGDLGHMHDTFHVKKNKKNENTYHNTVPPILGISGGNKGPPVPPFHFGKDIGRARTIMEGRRLP